MEFAKKGSRISINLRKRPFFFQGEEGINLREGQETAIVPETISDRHLDGINHAIRLDHLFVGWPPGKEVEIPEKEEDREKILYNGRKKIDEFVTSLKNNKNISSEEKIATLETLIELEKEGKNEGNKARKSVIALIERSLSSIGGISPVVEEEEKEKVEIQLTKGTEEPEE
jgi:hypothetical protein